MNIDLIIEEFRLKVNNYKEEIGLKFFFLSHSHVHPPLTRSNEPTDLSKITHFHSFYIYLSLGRRDLFFFEKRHYEKPAHLCVSHTQKKK